MDTSDDIQFTYDVDPLDVAEFFIAVDQARDEPDVTPMKLQKLLYLAQANYLASTGQRLFDADVEAFEHGPVVHPVWKAYSGKQIIADLGDNAPTRLPHDVHAFLEEVWLRYQDWSASALRRLTHRQAPWLKNYSEGAKRAVIPDDEMAAYFRSEVPVNERIFHPSVVVVGPDAFQDDEEADRRLQAFLAS